MNSKEALLKFAFNQLLGGIAYSEMWDNLNLYECLKTDEEYQEFLEKLEQKAADSGLVIDGEYLRPRTALESFLHNAGGNLSSTVADGIVTLESDGLGVQMALSYIPELILKQTVPSVAQAFLAYVYFSRMDGGK